jgi:hypothetical protein
VRRALLLIALLASACRPSSRHSSAETAAADPKDLEKKFYIPAGKFAEINLQMPAGAQANADYVVEEGGNIEWNVHSHPGKDVVVHDEGDGPKGNLAFTAPEDGAYSYLWENKKGKKNVMLRVRLTLSGGARVTSMVP